MLQPNSNIESQVKAPRTSQSLVEHNRFESTDTRMTGAFGAIPDTINVNHSHDIVRKSNDTFKQRNES